MERVSIMNSRSRLSALLSGLALAFTVTACGHVDSEQEPNIDYEGFAESVAELPAVASVESAAAGEAFVAEISAEADEAALRTTGRRSRDALIAALRGSDWQGTARITFEHPPCLTFESTADGKALNPHCSQHEASTELFGWGQEVIDAWDATAG